MSLLPQLRAPCSAQQGQASSPQGGLSCPRVVRGEERVCGETGGEMRALTPLSPAAIFSSWFDSLLLLPAIVGTCSINQPI